MVVACGWLVDWLQWQDKLLEWMGEDRLNKQQVCVIETGRTPIKGKPHPAGLLLLLLLLLLLPVGACSALPWLCGVVVSCPAGEVVLVSYEQLTSLVEDGKVTPGQFKARQTGLPLSDTQHTSQPASSSTVRMWR